MTDLLITYGPSLKGIAWKFFFFGIGWQFLRWFILTSWLIKTIEKAIGYTTKTLLEQGFQILQFLLQFVSENGKGLLQEFWKYRLGKIIIGIFASCFIYYIISNH